MIMVLNILRIDAFKFSKKIYFLLEEVVICMQKPKDIFFTDGKTQTQSNQLKYEE